MDLVAVDPQLNLYDRRLADPHLSAELAAAEVRVCRAGAGGPPRPGAGQHRLPGLRSSPAARSSVRSSAPNVAHQQLRPGGGLDPLRRRRRRPARQDPPGDHRQGACTFPPASRSATTTTWTAPAASPSPKTASRSSPRRTAWISPPPARNKSSVRRSTLAIWRENHEIHESHEVIMITSGLPGFSCSPCLSWFPSFG